MNRRWRHRGRQRGLRVGPDDLDATRFERLARDGRAVLPSDPVAAETLLGEALALWRGDALADVAFEPFAQGEVARLGELRWPPPRTRSRRGSPPAGMPTWSPTWNGCWPPTRCASGSAAS